MRFRRLLQTAALALGYSGCASFSALQPAQPLPPKAVSYFAAIGTQSVYFRASRSDPDYEIKRAIGGLHLPLLEFGARMGIYPRWDGGLRATLPGVVSADVKYLLWERDRLAFSTGFGVGLARLWPGLIEEGKAHRFVDWFVPLYGSYTINPEMSLHGHTQYLQRRVNTYSTSDTHETLTFASLGGGAQWRSWFAEATLTNAIASRDAYLVQMTFGWRTGWDQRGALAPAPFKERPYDPAHP